MKHGKEAFFAITTPSARLIPTTFLLRGGLFLTRILPFTTAYSDDWIPIFPPSSFRFQLLHNSPHLHSTKHRSKCSLIHHRGRSCRSHRISSVKALGAHMFIELHATSLHAFPHNHIHITLKSDIQRGTHIYPPSYDKQPGNYLEMFLSHFTPE